jgi:hypothetical protein
MKAGNQIGTAGIQFIISTERSLVFLKTPGDRSEPNILLLDERSIRRPSWALAPVLVLAIAVFAWGLHYKLSLYHSEARRAGGPEAKLLSPKERSASIGKIETTTFAKSLFTAPDRPIHPTGTAFPSGLFLGANLRIESFLQPQHGPSAPRFPLFSISNPRAPPIHV